MRAIILNGGGHDDVDLLNIQNLICDELGGMGWEYEPLVLHKIRFASCMGGFGCFVKQPGVCTIKDRGRDIARAFINSDMVILLSPVTFGGYSALLKKALERLIGLTSPFIIETKGEFQHKKRYQKYPALAAIGVLDKEDEEARHIFKTLVSRNALNILSPSSASEVIIRNEDMEVAMAKIRGIFSMAGGK